MIKSLVGLENDDFVDLYGKILPADFALWHRKKRKRKKKRKKKESAVRECAVRECTCYKSLKLVLTM